MRATSARSGASQLPRKLFAAARGLLYAAGFVALWTWLALAARRYDPRLPFTLGEPLRPVGLALALVGGALALWCVLAFAARGLGTPAPFDAPRVFVATGPYRRVRNPMYLGGAGVLAGAGLLVASPAILLLAAGFLLFFHAFVVLYEEPTLRAEFGESYVRYTESVRRWLPAPLPGVTAGVIAALGGVYLLVTALFPGAVALVRSLF